MSNTSHPDKYLIPSALIVLPKKSSLIPEAGCGQSPRKKQSANAFIFDAKNPNNLYKK